jgi:hypothetical protein
MAQSARNELVARRHLDRAQDREIANPLLSQRLNQPLASAAEGSSF